MSTRIRIGISSCLLGQKVRYDGGHKRNAFITGKLGKLFEFVPFCPEVAVGLGVPRPPIRLVRAGRVVRAQGVDDPTLDVTGDLADNAGAVAATQNVSGYIFKSRSPSCGTENVPLYDTRGKPVGTSSGLYAHRLMALLPALPCEEDERLMDPAIRKSFLERVFVYHRWQQFMAGRPTPRRLAAFHAQHESAIPAGDVATRRALARLVTAARRGAVRAVADRYLRRLMQALKQPAPRAHAGRRTGSEWSVYMLRCADGSLYTGVATDVAARIAVHNRSQGAKYTRGRGPVRLVYQERAGSRGAALKREFAIKRLPRAAKLGLIARRP